MESSTRETRPRGKIGYVMWLDPAEGMKLLKLYRKVKWRHLKFALNQRQTVSPHNAPQLPLLPPIWNCRDRPHLPLLDQSRPASIGGRNRISSWMSGARFREVHDLRYPGPRDVAQPRQVGVIAHLALRQQPLEPDGQRHEPGDPGHAPKAEPGPATRGVAQAICFRPCRAVREVNLALERQTGLYRRHAAASSNCSGQRLDAVGPEGHRDRSVLAVVVHPLDQQLNDSCLLPRAKRVPNRVEDR